MLYVLNKAGKMTEMRETANADREAWERRIEQIWQYLRDRNGSRP